MYKLYYYPLNASMASRFILEKTGAKHELVLVDRNNSAQKDPDYLTLNPLGRIPTLVDGDVVVFESPAICLYLAERHLESNLIPIALSSDRALFFQWLMYLTNTLQAELMVHSYPEKYLSDKQAAITLRHSSEQRITEMLQVIDAQLVNRDYLIGDSLSVCDYFLFMLCIWADELDKPPLSFPSLARHLKKMAALKEVSTVCNDENINLNDYLAV